MTEEKKKKPLTIDNFLSHKLSDWYQGQTNFAIAAYHHLDEQTKNALRGDPKSVENKTEAFVQNLMGGFLLGAGTYALFDYCGVPGVHEAVSCHGNMLKDLPGVFMGSGAFILWMGIGNTKKNRAFAARAKEARGVLDAEIDRLKQEKWDAKGIVRFVDDRGRLPKSQNELSQWKAFEDQIKKAEEDSLTKIKSLKQKRDNAVPGI